MQLVAQIQTLYYATSSTEHIQNVVFVGEGPHLVAATQHAVYVWNLLSCDLAFSYWLPGAMVAAHSTTGKFVVVATIADEVCCPIMVVILSTNE